MMEALRRVADIRRIAGFVAAGGTSAVATLAVRALLMHLTPFEAAVALAHIFGLTLAFTLNRLFVFNTYKGPLLPAYLRFFAVNMGSLAIATTVSSLLYRLIFTRIEVPYSDYVAHFIGLGAAAVPSYLGHSLFSFRNKAGATEAAPAMSRDEA